VVCCMFLTLAAIPFAPGLQGLDFDIGVFYLSSISSLSVIGILLAGWSSNNKYSLIGGIRSGAQIISYELSVAMSLITMVILSGTMQFSGIVEGQRDLWFIFKGHIPALISFIVFLIAGTAETNRGPFDLPEAESELTAGFHTEYSGIKFGLFYLAEFLNMFIVSAVAATVFLGGWMPLHFGALEGFNHMMDFIPPVIWFFLKTFGLVFVLMWFKWTFPRLRVDQILTLEWKYLLPINLFNILLMTVVVLTKFHF
jgi:NADH-quinone oxidoreductase subunit H